MNQEIELKIKISEAQLESLRLWLDKKAKKIKDVEHEEYYLNNPNQSFLFKNELVNNIKDADDYLRVRMTHDKDSVTLKKFHRDSKNPGHHTHCDEYEFEVSDGKIALDMFKQLGYTDLTDVSKEREIFETDDFEIVIDEVKDLGIFVEIECAHDFENPKEGIESIYELLREIGIKKFKSMKRGYVSMKWNPEEDFGEDVELN